jgi:hypothetical protein
MYTAWLPIAVDKTYVQLGKAKIIGKFLLGTVNGMSR